MMNGYPPQPPPNNTFKARIAALMRGKTPSEDEEVYYQPKPRSPVHRPPPRKMCWKCKGNESEVDGLCEERWDAREFARENASELRDCHR